MDKQEVSLEDFKNSNVTLILDSYNDLFSSFDSRSYAEKALSVDFLSECKRAVRDKDDMGFELILSIPRIKRNLQEELMIKKRFREHFHRHYLDKEKEVKKIKNTGKIWIVIGAILMMINTTIHTYIENLNFFINLVLVLTEPASWFSFWE